MPIVCASITVASSSVARIAAAVSVPEDSSGGGVIVITIIRAKDRGETSVVFVEEKERESVCECTCV